MHRTKPNNEHVNVNVKVTQLCLTLCDPVDCNSPWDSPGQNTAVGSLSLLQQILLIQESKRSQTCNAGRFFTS